MVKHSSISIRNMTATRVPRVAFDAHKREVLGSSYELSLAFAPPREALRLNRTYRKRTYAPNILSFPLGPRSGEIVICPSVAKRQAKKEGESYVRFVERLFIHGLLHLKGHRHGSRMERMAGRIFNKSARRHEVRGVRR